MAEKSALRTRFGLGLKLSLFVTVLVLVVSGSMAFFLIRQSSESRQTALDQQVASLGRMIGSMRGTSLERKVDPALLRMYVEQAHSMGTTLCFAIFLDAEGKLDGGYLNTELLSAAAPAIASDFKGLDKQAMLAKLASWSWTSEPVRDFRIGLRDSDGKSLGAALLGFSTLATEEAISKAITTNLIVTAAAFLISLAAALVFAGQFVRPIRSVALAMQQVSEGELDLKLSVKSRDEVGVLASSFNVMVEGLVERGRIRTTFARYVSDQVAERILKEDNDLDLSGELRQVTVLFLDIRGFTSLTEFLHPREVVALLNDYFGIIIEIVFRYEGTINKFIGDSIMAIYGAPATIDQPEMRAVSTAVEIQKAVGEYNWSRMQEGKPVVNFGIGIHSGEAIAGNIGSALRMEYTVIGRDVNLAQRIESATREGQVLISDSTAQRLTGGVELHKKDAVFMKGIVEPIQLWEVTGLLDAAEDGSVNQAGDRRSVT